MNKHNSFRTLALASALTAFALPAFAYWTPLQINLFGDVGLPPAAESVYGVRANLLYGKCDTVAVFDVGLFNHAVKDTYGVRAGVANGTDGNAYGISASVFNFDECNTGLSLGVANLATDAAGLQVGLLNGANTYAGVQIGLVNVAAKELSGVQIGLLNFMLKNDIPVLPLINVGFGN